jgi:hypothetical protein
MSQVRSAALSIAALGVLLWTALPALAQATDACNRLNTEMIKQAGAAAASASANAAAPQAPRAPTLQDALDYFSRQPSTFDAVASVWVTRGDLASVTFTDNRINTAQSAGNICVEAFINHDANRQIGLQAVLLENPSPPDNKKSIKVLFNEYPPSASYLYDEVQYTFVGILGGQNDQNPPIVFSYSTNFTVLTRLTVGLLTALFVLIAYGILVGATYPTDDLAAMKKQNEPRLAYLLSPVRISAGAFGEASMSQMQVILFTVVVATLLFQAWLRTGVLAGISMQLLYLLGISAVGAGSARYTETLKTALSGPTARYLIAKGWYNWQPEPLQNRATFARLFLTDGRLDVYKFQMALFTIVVAAYVISAGQNDLSNVNISDTMLYLIGISQGVYVGGKAVTDRTADLEDATKTMIDIEKQLQAVPAPAADQITKLNAQYQKAASRAAKEYGPLTHHKIPTDAAGNIDPTVLQPAGIVIADS